MPRKVVNKLSRQVIDLDFTETRRKSTREDRSKEDRAAISQITGSRESALLGEDADGGDERGASARNKFTAAPMEMRREETNEMTTYAKRGGGRTRQPEAEI